MKYRIDTKHQSQPAGGWGYAVPDGPILSSEKVGEPGLRELIGKIKDHRSSNGLPAGDPEHDIAVAYATKCPWLIVEQPDGPESDTYAEDWVSLAWKSYPMQQAEARVRDERFAQCEKCIHFEPLPMDAMSREAVRKLLCLNPHKSRVEHGWCQLRGWVPSVAAQVLDPWNLADWTKKTPECWLDREVKKADKPL